MNEKKGNQTESEALALWGTGRKGVEDMLAKMGPEIQKTAAPNVRGDFDVWQARALVEIANRDELKTVLSTREGVFSVYKCLTKFSTMGLQIGGQFPHAYLVPFAGKAAPVVTADGYAFACAHGPGAVLVRIPKLEHVYEKDAFHLDAAAAMVKHDFDPFGDRGKVVGYYMVLDYLDGHREISTATPKEVEEIEKSYSNKTGPAWTKSLQEMHDSKAAKQLLKKPMRESEGLAMLLSLDDYEAPEYTPPPRDIGERMADRLDASMRTVEPEPDEVPEAASEPAEDGDDVF